MSDEALLDDAIEPGLDVVFCGNALSAASRRREAYYAGPGNSFWPTLQEIGLTPRRLEPEEWRTLPQFGIGITDLCKVRSGSDEEVGSEHYDVLRLRAAIEASRPGRLAFVGKRAAEHALGHKLDYGLQVDRFAEVQTWVMPSTSGAARKFWDIAPWNQLAKAVRSGARSATSRR